MWHDFFLIKIWIKYLIVGRTPISRSCECHSSSENSQVKGRPSYASATEVRPDARDYLCHADNLGDGRMKGQIGTGHFEDHQKYVEGE
eukprot:scaffold574730_cov20-Prasinocladus_malaysianus.AAC.1